MPRSSNAATAVPTAVDAASARDRRTLPLRDLDIAPENLRAGEPPDEEVPLLADTLFAAGQLQPLTVRPGRRKERPFLALDGRRRLLALRLLVKQGRIGDDFPVDVFVEADPARQAAAVILTNTAVPVHVADVIAAIGRMLRAKLGIGGIARALGYSEIEVKRLAALSALPKVALDALRAGRLTLRQARLLARLPSREAQADLARAALDGHGFADWRVTEQLDAGRVTASDPRCALAPPERYLAAGGRIETDLFDERPPVLLDPAVLTTLWVARVGAIAAVFEAEGLTVHVTAGDDDLVLPEDLEQPGYVYGGRLPAEEMARYRDAEADHDAAADAVRVRLARGEGGAEDEAALIALVRTRLVQDQIALGGRVATVVVLSPARGTGLRVESWTPVEPQTDADLEDGAVESRDAAVDAAPAFAAPRAEAPAPDLEGVGHALHRLRTDVATRGLIRALADDPRTAMTALIARLFMAVAVRGVRPESALTLTGQLFGPRDGRVIDALDGVVRRRLDDRRGLWEASGQTLIAWVHGLEDPDRSACLADLTALTLDLTETHTTTIRHAARAEAAELAALSGAAIGRHWTPDTVFLAAHSKGLLRAMLQSMGEASPSGAPGKGDLIALVQAVAAARGWTPSALSWAVAPEGSGSAETDAAPAGSDRVEDHAPEDEAEGGDGGGAFEVTAAGVAALQAVAE